MAPDRNLEVQARDGFGSDWKPMFHTDNKTAALDYIRKHREGGGRAGVEYRIKDTKTGKLVD